MNFALISAAGYIVPHHMKAIKAVSLFGQCADMAPLGALAEARGLAVVEDAAQSLGATYHGRPSGSLSRVAATSFFPSKPLGAYGDGGALFTDDDRLADRLRSLAQHGEVARYHHLCWASTAAWIPSRRPFCW